MAIPLLLSPVLRSENSTSYIPSRILTSYKNHWMAAISSDEKLLGMERNHTRQNVQGIFPGYLDRGRLILLATNNDKETSSQ